MSHTVKGKEKDAKEGDDFPNALGDAQGDALSVAHAISSRMPPRGPAVQVAFGYSCSALART